MVLARTTRARKSAGSPRFEKTEMPPPRSSLEPYSNRHICALWWCPPAAFCALLSVADYLMYSSVDSDVYVTAQTFQAQLQVA